MPNQGPGAARESLVFTGNKPRFLLIETPRESQLTSFVEAIFTTLLLRKSAVFLLSCRHFYFKLIETIG